MNNTGLKNTSFTLYNNGHVKLTVNNKHIESLGRLNETSAFIMAVPGLFPKEIDIKKINQNKIFSKHYFPKVSAEFML